ncbi:MAG: acyl carrier protein [Planctomycetota bacterium]
MVDSDITEPVREVFCEEFELPEDELVPEAEIFDDLGLDSLDVVDLIVALQRKFGVKLRNDERIRQVRTLQDLYEYLETVRREKKGN